LCAHEVAPYGFWVKQLTALEAGQSGRQHLDAAGHGANRSAVCVDLDTHIDRGNQKLICGLNESGPAAVIVGATEQEVAIQNSFGRLWVENIPNQRRRTDFASGNPSCHPCCDLDLGSSDVLGRRPNKSI
jgi:hypothetical protein